MAVFRGNFKPAPADPSDAALDKRIAELLGNKLERDPPDPRTAYVTIRVVVTAWGGTTLDKFTIQAREDVARAILEWKTRDPRWHHKTS